MEDLTRASSSGEPFLKRTFSRTCGKGSNRCAASEAGLPSCAITASTCKRRDQPVAGGGEIRKNDVAGLFAAHIEAAFVHLFEHIAVAHRGARQIKTQRLLRYRSRPALDITVPTTPPPLSSSPLDQLLAIKSQNLVAVDDAAHAHPPSPPGRRRHPARCRNRRALRAPWRTSLAARSNRNPD